MQTLILRFSVLALGALALAATAALFIGSGDTIRAGLLKPDDADLTARGRQVYEQNCAACHGADLKGEPDWRSPDSDGLMPAPPQDESGHTWHHSEKLLFELTKYGIAKTAGLNEYQTRMPIFDGVLSDDEIIAVLSYIKSRWPDDIQRRHTEMSAHDR